MQLNPQILIQQLNYILPSGTPLFRSLTLSIAQQKTGLVGRNGIGKSTLLKLIIGELSPNAGAIQTVGKIAYVPQNPGIEPKMTIASMLGFAEKLDALQRIAQGSTNEADFTLLNEDWDAAEQLHQQLCLFGLNTLSYHRHLSTLSGGEITRLFLTKAFFSHADILLLDEPTNHLDSPARKQFYAAIEKWQGGLIISSHDRTLLNLLEQIIELNTLGAQCYGGNYESYLQQKTTEQTARELQLHDAKKTIQKNRQAIQTTHEKHQQKQSYGRQLRRNGSIDKLAANSAKGRSERTQHSLLIKEERLLQQAKTRLQAAKEKIEIIEQITVELPATQVPRGKMLVEIEDLSFVYPGSSHHLIENFNLKIMGPQRIALARGNGSGKTSLLKLILGELIPVRGTISLGTTRVNYLDQNINLLNPELSILTNFIRLNPEINETTARLYLAQFLFRNTAALKNVKDLSGGEKLRALLACVLLSKNPPQLLILDEPTNHLDLVSITHIESALKNYQGAMIVIAHDQRFLENIGIEKVIHAPFTN